MSGGLGALSQAWVTVEAAKPLGWKLTGLVLTDDDEWIATARGPDGQLAEGGASYPEQALRLLADALLAPRALAPMTGIDPPPGRCRVRRDLPSTDPELQCKGIRVLVGCRGGISAALGQIDVGEERLREREEGILPCSWSGSLGPDRLAGLVMKALDRSPREHLAHQSDCPLVNLESGVMMGNGTRTARAN